MLFLGALCPSKSGLLDEHIEHILRRTYQKDSTRMSSVLCTPRRLPGSCVSACVMVFGIRIPVHIKTFICLFRFRQNTKYSLTNIEVLRGQCFIFGALYTSKSELTHRHIVKHNHIVRYIVISSLFFRLPGQQCLTVSCRYRCCGWRITGESLAIPQPITGTHSLSHRTSFATNR